MHAEHWTANMYWGAYYVLFTWLTSLNPHVTKKWYRYRPLVFEALTSSHWSTQEVVALACGAFNSRAWDLNPISYSAGVGCCLCLPGSTLPPWGKRPSNSPGEVSLPVSNLGKPDNQGAATSLAIQSAYNNSRADYGFPAWLWMLRDPNCRWFVSSVLPWQGVWPNTWIPRATGGYWPNNSFCPEVSQREFCSKLNSSNWW